MGTRSLICVVQGGQFRVAQYSQWDGYPRGQGQKIVDFLTRPGAVASLKRIAPRVRQLNADEVRARWDGAGLNQEAFLSKEARAQVMHLDRDCGARILDYLVNSAAPEVFLSDKFAGDSLFCEYAYVIDLDVDRLEFYRGFNKEPLNSGERFYGYERHNDSILNEQGWMPVRLVRSYAFSQLTPDTMSQLGSEEEER